MEERLRGCEKLLHCNEEGVCGGNDDDSMQDIEMMDKGIDKGRR